jgi:transcriptional regulator with XRE-family HTH domain
MPKRQTMEALRSDLPLNFKKIREAQGVAQEWMALDAVVDRTVVSKIERCVGNPSLDTLRKLANRLDTTVSALLAPKCFFSGLSLFSPNEIG